MPRIVAVFCLAGFVLACTQTRTAGPASTPQRDLRSEASAFYDRYQAALRAGARERLASFYTPEGALVVLNGRRMQLTRAGIDSIYRGSGWQPPTYFAFDDLEFAHLNDRQMLVTGHFRWLREAGADTSRVVYLAILQALDTGMAIRLEHETQSVRR